MQTDRLEKIFKSCCSAFPTLDFGICSSQGQPIHVHSPAGYPEELFSREAGVIAFQGNSLRLVTFPLPPDCSMSALFRLDDFGYAAFPSMVETLVKAIDGSRAAALPQNTNTLFFNHILQTETLDRQSCLSLLATDFPYDFSLPRFFCVIQVLNANGNRKISRRVTLQILQHIRDYSVIQEQDITGVLEQDKLILCKTIQPSDYPLKQYCTQTLSGFFSRLQTRFSVSFRIGIGFVAENISEYSFCLKAAYQTLPEDSSGEMFHFAIDRIHDYLFADITPRQLDHYLLPYVQVLNAHPDWLVTLDALVENNLDPLEAAEKLYLHPNSITSRIRNMLQNLNLDSLHSDQTKFFLILLHWYIHHQAVKAEPSEYRRVKHSG